MPFDFHVHERVLPAGKYVITTTAGNGNALMTDTSTGYSVIVSAGAYLGDTQAGKPRLVQALRQSIFPLRDLDARRTRPPRRSNHEARKRSGAN